MKQDAVRQAEERLSRAKAACLRFENSVSFEEAEAAWGDFLVAAHQIYSKLEKGANGDKKSAPWFGNKKHERKTDPLLSYIQHARNCDEHGIKDITERKLGRQELSVKNGAIHIQALDVDEMGRIVGIKATPANHGAALQIETVPAKLILVAVFDDKHNDTFPVPDTHMGIALQDLSPLNVMRISLSYFGVLINEASAFVSK